MLRRTWQGMFARPARFERVWGLPKGVNKNILWLWRPIPPSDDFVALGFVGSGDPDDPPKVAVASLRCVHRSLCTQVILAPAPAASNEGGSSRLLVPLPAVSSPWVSACGSLEPPRQDGENAQKTGKDGYKTAQIRPNN